MRKEVRFSLRVLKMKKMLMKNNNNKVHDSKRIQKDATAVNKVDRRF